MTNTPKARFPPPYPTIVARCEAFVLQPRTIFCDCSQRNSPPAVVAHHFHFAVCLLVELLGAHDTEVVGGGRRQRQAAIGQQRAQDRALVKSRA